MCIFVLIFVERKSIPVIQEQVFIMGYHLKIHRQKNYKLLPKCPTSQPVAFGPVFSGGLIGFSLARVLVLCMAGPH